MIHLFYDLKLKNFGVFFQIKAFSGAVYLLQHDHQVEATNWFSAISGVIKKLVSSEYQLWHQ